MRVWSGGQNALHVNNVVDVWQVPAQCFALLIGIVSASQVTVELKNDLAIKGTLHSVDQYLNIKLHNTQVRIYCPQGFQAAMCTN